MAPPPPPRARSVPKSSFPSYFARLKTSTYNDRPASHAPPPASHAIRTLSWNAPGSLIATGAGDRTLRIWNPEKPHVKNSTELRGHAGAVERVVFRPSHESELASCGSDGTVRLWDVRRKELVGEVKVGNEALFLSWRPDGEEILVGRKDDTLVPIDIRTMTALTYHKESVQTNQCVFSWSSRHLFSTHGDGTVKISRYDTSGLSDPPPSSSSTAIDTPSPTFLTPIHTLNAHTSSCYTLSLSPKANYLAIGGSDALLTLWDTEDWICLHTLDRTPGPVKSVSFSCDGSYVVGGSDEAGVLDVAHVETGEYVHEIKVGQPGGVGVSGGAGAGMVQWHPSRFCLAYAGEMGLKVIGAEALKIAA